jgi:hypothetical protein
MISVVFQQRHRAKNRSRFMEKTMRTDAEELRQQYSHWGEHDQHKVAEWQREVAESNTRLGYWEWVATLLQEEDETAP